MRKSIWRDHGRTAPIGTVYANDDYCPRFCGPPNSGNGGYVCGRLARHIPGGAEVTLRAPPPLDRPLDIVATNAGSWELRDGATVVAIGRPSTVELPRLEKASFDEAAAAELLC